MRLKWRKTKTCKCPYLAGVLGRGCQGVALRKEAVAKATGLGLQLALTEIEIDAQTQEQVVDLPTHIGGADRLRLQSLHPPLADYYAAVAIVGDRPFRLKDQGVWTNP